MSTPTRHVLMDDTYPAVKQLQQERQENKKKRTSIHKKEMNILHLYVVGKHNKKRKHSSHNEE